GLLHLVGADVEAREVSPIHSLVRIDGHHILVDLLCLVELFALDQERRQIHVKRNVLGTGLNAFFQDLLCFRLFALHDVQPSDQDSAPSLSSISHKRFYSSAALPRSAPSGSRHQGFWDRSAERFSPRSWLCRNSPARNRPCPFPYERPCAPPCRRTRRGGPI